MVGQAKARLVQHAGRAGAQVNPNGRIEGGKPNDFDQFRRDGFQIIPSLVSDNECERLSAELTPLYEQHSQTTKARIGGVRNLLSTNQVVSELARKREILSFLQQATGAPLFPVRCIFFDKNPVANWNVPWHQDLAIAVVKRIETPGFSGWSLKDGVQHVHPPADILAGMITMRLHLDDCDATNGALKVIVGSHSAGKISVTEMGRWTARGHVVCVVKKGDALLMRPLLLHASSPSDQPRHRRVLHIEYATQKLPDGLEWRFN